MSLLTFVKLSNPKFMPLICMYYIFSLLPVYSLCETFKKWLFFLLLPSLVLIKACDICIFLHCHCALAFNHQMALFAFSLGCSFPLPSPSETRGEAWASTHQHRAVSMPRARPGSHQPPKVALVTGRCKEDLQLLKS